MSDTGREAELHRALTLCYGDYPPGWSNQFSDILRALEVLPKVNGRDMPLVTYFFYVTTEKSLNTMRFVNAFISETVVKDFIGACSMLEDNAKVTAAVDFQCFDAEVRAFENTEEAIQDPHLDVSPLYRYLAAVQQDQIVLITDDLQKKAIHQIRQNPYSFFAYGEDFVPLMPITWGEI